MLRPVLSFIAALAGFAAAFSVVHWVSFKLALPDLVALLLFALPIVAYIAYCTHDRRQQMLRAGGVIYTGFAATVLACAGLVYLID